MSRLFVFINVAIDRRWQDRYLSTPGRRDFITTREGTCGSSSRHADAIMVGGRTLLNLRKKGGRSRGRARQRSSGWVCSDVVIGNYPWPDGGQANSPHCARLALTAHASASIVATPQLYTRRLNAHPTHTYSVR